MFTLLQTVVHPIEEAFVEGKLELPTTAEVVQGVSTTHWDDSILLVIVATVSLIGGILLLRMLLNINSSLLGCVIRSKECYNLESSAQLSRERDIIAIFITFPVCLVISYYRLWELNFMAKLGPGLNYLITLGAVILYILLRTGISILLTPRSYNVRTYKVALKTFDTFYIVAAMLLFATAAAMGVFRVDHELTRITLFWELLATYALQIVRKAQILGSTMPFLTTILYLCALEIIPTGILVATAVFL